MTSQGVSNSETSYYDGYEYKVHTSDFRNALDCVAFIGEDIELNARSGIVRDGKAEVRKRIHPYQDSEE